MILDFEGGTWDVLKTLPGLDSKWFYRRIKSWDDYNSAYAELETNDLGIKSCGIDSISETHIYALMHILDTKGANRSNPDLIEQGDYGVGLVQIRRLVRSFRDLPMHTFFTAHHKDEVDPRLGMTKLVNLPGKAATEVPGLMTAVGYLTKDNEGTRCMVFGGDPKIRTKIRLPWGSDPVEVVDDPTVTDILNLLKI
jgi:hypothetical protein